MNRLELLDKVYNEYHREEYIYPDPLSPVLSYKNADDREVAAVIASSLALGRVDLILKAVNSVLLPLGSHPASELDSLSVSDLREIYHDFVYRFFKTDEITGFLYAIKVIRGDRGSLQALFTSNYTQGKGITSGITALSNEIARISEGKSAMLLPSPEKGSACKRVNLFLRWMVRHDNIDPGGWSDINTCDLLVPVDTHMYDIAKRLRFTSRKTADFKTAVEITAGFAEIVPEDPVKYDFSLTRLGIHPDLDKEIFKNLNFKGE